MLAEATETSWAANKGTGVPVTCKPPLPDAHELLVESPSLEELSMGRFSARFGDFTSSALSSAEKIGNLGAPSVTASPSTRSILVTVDDTALLLPAGICC